MKGGLRPAERLTAFGHDIGHLLNHHGQEDDTGVVVGLHLLMVLCPQMRGVSE